MRSTPMSVANSEPTAELGAVGASAANTVRDGSRAQTAQPSLGLRGKRASRPVPPSKPECRRRGRRQFANYPPTGAHVSTYTRPVKLRMEVRNGRLIAGTAEQFVIDERTSLAATGNSRSESQPASTCERWGR